MSPSLPAPARQHLRRLPIAAAMALLSACGGGGGGGSAPAPTPPAPAPALKTGQFIDSPVQGLEVYVDGAKVGSTDAAGQFSYPEGKTVTFKIGALTLGSASAPSTVTPADLSADPQSVLNILVALQSLDSDRNPANGISIAPDSAAKLLTAADLSQKGSSLSSLSKDLPALALVAQAAALSHFWGSAQNLTPNAMVQSAVDKLAGFWHFQCDGQGRSVVWDIRKAGANRLQRARAIVHDHLDAQCSSSAYVEKTETHDGASDFFTVMGASLDAAGALTAQGYSPNGDQAPEPFSVTLAADANSFKLAGSAFTSVKRLSSFAFPGGSTPAPSVAANTLSVSGGESYPLRVSFSLDDKGLINGGGYDFHKVKGSMTPCTYGPGNADNCEGSAAQFGQTTQHGMFSAQGAATPTVLMGGPDQYGFSFAGILTGLDWVGSWTKVATPNSARTGAGNFAVQVVFGDGQVPGQAPGPGWSGPPSNNPAALRVWLALDGQGKVDVKTMRSRYDTHADASTGAPCTVSNANMLSCNGRSDVFLIAKAGGPLNSTGAATPTTLQLIDGNGTVWTGTVTGKTWTGVWNSAPGVLPALSVEFSVVLQLE